MRAGLASCSVADQGVQPEPSSCADVCGHKHAAFITLLPAKPCISSAAAESVCVLTPRPLGAPAAPRCQCGCCWACPRCLRPPSSAAGGRGWCPSCGASRGSRTWSPAAPWAGQKQRGNHQGMFCSVVFSPATVQLHARRHSQQHNTHVARHVPQQVHGSAYLTVQRLHCKPSWCCASRCALFTSAAICWCAAPARLTCCTRRTARSLWCAQPPLCCHQGAAAGPGISSSSTRKQCTRQAIVCYTYTDSLWHRICAMSRV